jgi:hypothetical protein
LASAARAAAEAAGSLIPGFDGYGYPDLIAIAGGRLLVLRNDGQW